MGFDLGELLNTEILHEVIGWIGAFCFAICGLPQALECHRRGNSHGISPSFTFLWLTGELCTLAYVLPEKQYPLIFNYIGNIFFVAVILKYKFFPVERTSKATGSDSLNIEEFR